MPVSSYGACRGAVRLDLTARPRRWRGRRPSLSDKRCSGLSPLSRKWGEVRSEAGTCTAPRPGHFAASIGLSTGAFGCASARMRSTSSAGRKLSFTSTDSHAGIRGARGPLPSRSHRGDDDDRNIAPAAAPSAGRRRQLKAVHLGHHQVEQDQVGLLLAQADQRLVAVRRLRAPAIAAARARCARARADRDRPPPPERGSAAPAHESAGPARCSRSRSIGLVR